MVLQGRGETKAEGKCKIEAGETISSDCFNGIRAFTRATGREDLAGTVVYGSDEEQKRAQGVVVPLTKLQARLAAVSGTYGLGVPLRVSRGGTEARSKSIL